ncbi:hypothetical protein ABFS83_13G080700 [Erythranthe nasuta]|uniref:Uncharacterized protein n=1 Tax=Erythranthe guttata TaxID=4155 RepID=A0A022R3K8_ERYGU|nr:PREDICTED: uncharacterized protein LOC105962498 [Erythranthe guttata]EYU33405.1 hypothetical protein MIMGU_mgv1a017305mg [Erythranthe guttata]|eukprot:XP_012842270.1 PREDICTED: uncharacterized protein LOC105962498 [Erythranthe guttata]
MDPEHAGSAPESVKQGWRWKQMGNEEKTAAVEEEIKRVHQLPPKSSYACHRLRVLTKIHQLLSIQRTTSQEKELELLFSGLHI